MRGLSSWRRYLSWFYFILFFFYFKFICVILRNFCILSLPWKFINLFVTANIKKDHNGLNKHRRDGAIAGGVIGGVIVSLIPHFLLPSLPLLSFSPWGYYLWFVKLIAAIIAVILYRNRKARTTVSVPSFERTSKLSICLLFLLLFLFPSSLPLPSLSHWIHRGPLLRRLPLRGSWKIPTLPYQHHRPSLSP